MVKSWLAGDTSITEAKARKLRVCADCPSQIPPLAARKSGQAVAAYTRRLERGLDGGQKPMNEHLTLREHRQGDGIFQHDEGAWNVSAIREGINTEPTTFNSIDIPLSRTFIDYCKRNIVVDIKRARELTIALRDDPGIITMRERGDALHLFMIGGHHRAVRRWRDGLRQMKAFVIAEQVGELWRIKDTTLITLTETSKGKTLQ